MGSPELLDLLGLPGYPLKQRYRLLSSATAPQAQASMTYAAPAPMTYGAAPAAALGCGAIAALLVRRGSAAFFLLSENNCDLEFLERFLFLPEGGAGGAKRPRGARRRQEEPGGARRTQEDPGGPSRTQGGPGKDSKNQWGQPGDRAEGPIASFTQERARRKARRTRQGQKN